MLANPRLNEDTQTHQLPPESLTYIFYFVVDHGCNNHMKQLIPLTCLLVLENSVTILPPKYGPHYMSSQGFQISAPNGLHDSSPVCHC